MVPSRGREWIINPILADGYPPVGAFDLPHSLTLLRDLQWLCVADRLNGRVQCFDYNGAFIKQIHLKEFNGVVFGVSYSEADGKNCEINHLAKL